MNPISKAKAVALTSFAVSGGGVAYSYLSNTNIEQPKQVIKPVVKFQGGPLYKKCLGEIKIEFKGATKEGSCKFLYGNR